jgi:hypothetical protein
LDYNLARANKQKKRTYNQKPEADGTTGLKRKRRKSVALG